MGTYLHKQYELRYGEQNSDCELKVTEIKRIFGIPVICIKESKYRKVYSLFNKIKVFEAVNYGVGFDE